MPRRAIEPLDVRGAYRPQVLNELDGSTLAVGQVWRRVTADFRVRVVLDDDAVLVLRAENVDRHSASNLVYRSARSSSDGAAKTVGGVTGLAVVGGSC